MTAEDIEQMATREEANDSFLRTADGKVVVNRFDSHINMLARQYLPAAIAKINTGGRLFIVQEVEFDHDIGFSTLVKTYPNDEIIWAKRPGHAGYSRCVVGRNPEPTRFLTVVLKRAVKPNDIEGSYVLISAYIGPASHEEPDDIHRLTHPQTPEDKEKKRLRMERSRRFWAWHAFVIEFTMIMGFPIKHKPLGRKRRVKHG